MVSAQRRALARLWRDRCTVYAREKRTDSRTQITRFEETPLLENQPCRLSFRQLRSTGGEEVAQAAQGAKLFLGAEFEIPAGCRVEVARGGRVHVFASSGTPGVFPSHQEILLELWRGWA